MKKITEDLLQKIYPFSQKEKINLFLPLLNNYMSLYEIDTCERQAAFLANIGYHSGQLFYTENPADGNIYENNKSLGNVFRGDGLRFKERGLIPIVGRKQYSLISNALNIDFLAIPDLLKEPDFATQSACWLWHEYKLNSFADIPTDSNFKTLCEKIDERKTNYIEKQRIWKRAMQIMEK